MARTVSIMVPATPQLSPQLHNPAKEALLDCSVREYRSTILTSLWLQISAQTRPKSRQSAIHAEIMVVTCQSDFLF